MLMHQSSLCRNGACVTDIANDFLGFHLASISLSSPPWPRWRGNLRTFRMPSWIWGPADVIHSAYVGSLQVFLIQVTQSHRRHRCGIYPTFYIADQNRCQAIKKIPHHTCCYNGVLQVLLFNLCLPHLAPVRKFLGMCRPWSCSRIQSLQQSAGFYRRSLAVQSCKVLWCLVQSTSPKQNCKALQHTCLLIASVFSRTFAVKSLFAQQRVSLQEQFHAYACNGGLGVGTFRSRYSDPAGWC